MEGLTQASQETLRSIIGTIVEQSAKLNQITETIDGELNGYRPSEPSNMPEAGSMRDVLYLIRQRLGEALNNTERTLSNIGERVNKLQYPSDVCSAVPQTKTYIGIGGAQPRY